MNKYILFEINKIRDIMGLSLIMEQSNPVVRSITRVIEQIFEKTEEKSIQNQLRKFADGSGNSLEREFEEILQSSKNNAAKKMDAKIAIKNLARQLTDTELVNMFSKISRTEWEKLGVLTTDELAEIYVTAFKNNGNYDKILQSIQKIQSQKGFNSYIEQAAKTVGVSKDLMIEIVGRMDRGIYNKFYKTSFTTQEAKVIEDVEPKIFVFTKKTKTNEYINFKELDKPFKAEKGEKVILINKDNPNEKYEFTYKEDINQSKHRPNEAYIRIGGNLMKSSKFIRSCIEEAFPKDKYTWQKADEKYTEGLRGVYPISPQDDWSVLNFFDTNPWRQQSLYDMFLKSGQSNQREWLVNFLKSDSEALKKLITQQRNAIIKASANEINAISLITNNYHVSKEYGLKSDRHGGIDAIDKNTGKTYQIKTIQSVEEKVDTDTGEIISWEIKGLNSRLSDYKTKEDLNYLAYYIPEQKTVYVFKNQKYKVMNNDLVEHYEKPEIYK